MAHYAKLGLTSKVVSVHVVNNDVITDVDGKESEQLGIDFLYNLYNYPFWVQTSYNSTFRKNFASAGYKYDDDLDAFIPPKTFASWVLDESTCQWKAPTDYPDDGKDYYWDEDTTSWKEIT